MTQVLVFRSFGDEGTRLYGQVIGTDYIFSLSDFVPDTGREANGIFQAGEGVVFRGVNTDGFNDSLVFTNGSPNSSVVLINDSLGNRIEDPIVQNELSGQTVFVAQTDSVTDGNAINLGLYITNGSSVPQLLLPFAVQPLFGNSDLYSIVVDNFIYVQSRDGDLHRVDAAGNSTRIVEVEDFSRSLNLFLEFAFELDGDLYFQGRLSTSSQLYRVDTATGNFEALDIGINNGDAIFSGIRAGETEFYFFSNQNRSIGTELYVSDETAAGTRLVTDLNVGSGSSIPITSPNNNIWATIGDTLFFTADDGSSDDTELYFTDGTATGTIALTGTSTNVGPLSFVSQTIQALGNLVIFSASSATSGHGIYVSDGTVAGTQLLFESGAPIFNIHFTDEIGNFSNGLVFFSVGVNGEEAEAVYVTDGQSVLLLSDPLTPNLAVNTSANFINVVDLDLDNIPPRNIEGTMQDETINGDFLNEIINGLTGNDVLNGNSGNDILNGGQGNDVLNGGVGTDTTSYAGAAQGGVSVDLRFDGRDVGGGQGRDTFDSIENLIGTSFDDRLSGDAGDNELFGGDGNDVLRGQNGTDLLDGGAGDDNLRTGSGDDTLIGGTGEDFLIGLAGEDRLFGGSDIDFLFGGSGNDDLFGQGGMDNLRGNRGNDTVDGGSGNDIARGGGGNDTVAGGSGADSLFGENGRDTIDGGTGNDILRGGISGNLGDGFEDVFVFEQGYDFDIVRDFENGTDQLDLSSFGLSFSDIESMAEDRSSGLRVDFGSGDVLFIDDLTLAELTNDDVIL